MAQSPAALIVISSSLVGQSIWKELAGNRYTLKIFQSLGRQYLLLSFGAAESLKDLLLGAELNHEFYAFGGGLTISEEVIKRSADFMVELKNSN